MLEHVEAVHVVGVVGDAQQFSLLKAGDAALFFNPNDAQSMLDTLRETVKSEALRKQLSAAGLERIKEFSLSNMVQRTCEVYRKL